MKRELYKANLLFVGIILLISIISYPQNKNSQFITPEFENISIEDGLPENSVNCILQDYLGYLWLGTQNGLVRYDGYSMNIYQPEKYNGRSISGRRITVIFEDKYKTLWIGTLNGLNKFNRTDETFKTYRFNPKDSNSINSNEIYSVYEDQTGKFWVGTAEGLNLFNTDKETFTRFYFRHGDIKVYQSSKSYIENLCVNAITEDSLNGNLLIGTAEDGLREFNFKDKTLLKYRFTNIINPDKKIGWIQSFFKSRNGKIWMTSFHTLSCLDPQKKEYKSYIEFPIRKEERFTKRDLPCAGIVEDQNGLIWCGFYSGAQGVFSVNPQTSNVKNYKIDPDTSKNSYGNHINSIYFDRSDILWVGSWGLGLWKWDTRKIKFQPPFVQHYNFTNLINTTANSLAYDSNGFVWLVSHRGLEKYDLKSGRFIYYLQNENSITRDNIYTIFIDKSKNIWIATFRKGIIKFNPSTGSYHFLFNNPNEPENLLNKIILTIHQDNLGNIWIGTDGYGYYKYDLTKNKLTQFRNNPKDSLSITNNSARSFFEDRSGTLWFGTNFGGLNKFERKTETFEYYGFNCVLSIYEDKRGNFWVADYYTGLNLFDRKTKKVVRSYSRRDGLTSNSIWGILEDNNDNLWLKTDNGLFKFNTITKIIKHYTKEDGLSDNFFLPYPHSHCKGPDETMLFINSKFRSHNGIVIFHPDSIKDDPVPPNTIISKISLFNRPEEKINIKGFVSELKEITLPYDQNDLRFDFVGLQFSEPEKNKYKYILENFDKDWADAGNQRNATYTNLAPGEYIFKVNAANRDGVWNKNGASLKLIITPPWWKTWWAYLLFFAIIISIFISSTKFYLNRQYLKNRLVLESEHAEKLEELSNLKTSFFTNISHEFRTPLTLILGPAKQIIEQSEKNKVKENANLIYRSAKKLNRLANQLLDISRIEAGKMKLKAGRHNLIPLMREVISSFQAFAERKHISILFNPEVEELIIYLDKDKFDKIISNILSNSLKFTPAGGSVEFKINILPLPSEGWPVSLPASQDKGAHQNRFNSNYVEVSISDTGIGIPKDQRDKIFDRFYQVDNRLSKEYEGTGVGLSLTKELVELHKGKITVESEEGKGTTFSIVFPLGKEHLSPDEIINDEAALENELIENHRFSQILDESILSSAAIRDKKEINDLEKIDKPSLLIIEDNSDVRKYIIDILNLFYNIDEASNGEEGLKRSFELIPDLIISDIMMPKMDGFQLCSKLKTDSRTSHIPLILLTAKTTLHDKIEGLETGADDYIMKPFEADELKARIKNLLDQRKRIHEHFKSHGLFEIENSRITPVDQKFLQKICKIINNHLSETSFGVDLLVEEMSISKSLLYKKLIALAGEPPGELIKRMRLDKAVQLIEKNSGNITEIAFETGFNDPSYFTACFKKQFGKSPSQYYHEFTEK